MLLRLLCRLLCPYRPSRRLLLAPIRVSPNTQGAPGRSAAYQAAIARAVVRSGRVGGVVDVRIVRG